MALPEFDPLAILATFPSPEFLRDAGVLIKPTPFRAGETIRFGAPIDGRIRLVSGWSEPETKFAWTDGAEAHADLLIEPPSAGHLCLGLTCCAFIPGKPQLVTILANGVELARQAFADDRAQRLQLSLQAVDVRGGVLRLSFHIAHACSPAELGLSTDRRQLGIAVSELSLTADG
jgi:hypothetical protein